MSSPVVLLSFSRLALRFLPALLASSLKASFILALVCAAAGLLKNAPPRLRHLLWFSAIAGYLFILILSLRGPLLHFDGGDGWRTRSGMYGAVTAVLFPRESLPLPVIRGGVLDPARPGFWTVAWPAAAFLLWGAGVVISFSRYILGTLRLLVLSRHVGQEPLVQGLLPPVGIRRRVRVLLSERCRVPFTSGVLRPLIVLPSGLRTWPAERLRAVLSHELGHIRRGDALLQPIARAICSLFWFVPWIWSACNRLHLEQEKACDAAVVEAGVGRPLYAACLLEAACLGRENAPGPGLAARRGRILADRIESILGGGKAMKRGLVFFVLTALLVGALVVLGGAGGKKPLTDEQVWGRFVGGWENLKYQGVYPFPQKVVIRPDFSGEDWNKPTDPEPWGVWEARLKKRWTDWKGNTYCQYFCKYTKTPYTGAHGIGLLRVSRNGKVLEFNMGDGSENDAYPEKIDPQSLRKQRNLMYFIYYRKE